MTINFKTLRITTLILILFFASAYTYNQRVTSRAWTRPLQLILYPINANSDPVVETYIQQLKPRTFNAIDKFFTQQGEAYFIGDQPVITTLGEELKRLPPSRPRNGNIMSNLFWGLQLRYWAWRHTPSNHFPGPQVHIFVLYHQPVNGLALPHSTGLSKGLIGVVHAFAAVAHSAKNNIVIAHEFLHTVGATDKYNQQNYPIFPNGFADIEQVPLLPQFKAEIMAGRIPIAKKRASMPGSLSYCMVGKTTAREINWIYD